MEFSIELKVVRVNCESLSPQLRTYIEIGFYALNMNSMEPEREITQLVLANKIIY